MLPALFAERPPSFLGFVPDADTAREDVLKRPPPKLAITSPRLSVRFLMRVSYKCRSGWRLFDLKIIGKPDQQGGIGIADHRRPDVRRTAASPVVDAFLEETADSVLSLRNSTSSVESGIARRAEQVGDFAALTIRDWPARGFFARQPLLPSPCWLLADPDIEQVGRWLTPPTVVHPFGEHGIAISCNAAWIIRSL